MPFTLPDILCIQNNRNIGDLGIGQSPSPCLFSLPWKGNCHSPIFALDWVHLLWFYPTWKGNLALKLSGGFGCLTFSKDDQCPLLCVYAQLLLMKINNDQQNGLIQLKAVLFEFVTSGRYSAMLISTSNLLG